MVSIWQSQIFTKKKYPPESYPFDASKMTYTDVLYEYELGKETICTKTENGNSAVIKINSETLKDLIKCSKRMKEELESIH